MESKKEICIKNQLRGTVNFCIGMNKYSLEPERDIIAPVAAGDCLYIDQLSVAKADLKPVPKMLAEIIAIVDKHGKGLLTKGQALIGIVDTAADYFDNTPPPETDNRPIPYQLTDKGAAADD